MADSLSLSLSSMKLKHADDADNLGGVFIFTPGPPTEEGLLTAALFPVHHDAVVAEFVDDDCFAALLLDHTVKHTHTRTTSLHFLAQQMFPPPTAAMCFARCCAVPTITASRAQTVNWEGGSLKKMLQGGHLTPRYAVTGRLFPLIR